MARATRTEIQDYLKAVPNAQDSWVDVLFAARLSLGAVDKFVQRMSVEADSPLRVSEDDELSKEIVRVNGVFSNLSEGERGSGRVVVKVSAVMSASEMLRLNSLVGNFCQPVVKSNGRFGKNGHIVMNAVRRCTAGYQLSKVPLGARIAEVGPDVKNWLLDSESKPWESKGGSYVGARPVKTQRDVVRVQWGTLLDRIKDAGPGIYNEHVVDKAGVLRASYGKVFPEKNIQQLEDRVDYVISNDSNYDIAFADMPTVMITMGAKAWYGTMLRVKGLTTNTRMEGGTLDVMGVNYRVDWKAGRIDFRNPSCNAFGYSHNVFELVKYEERNGYVWTTRDANYVYAKGPETNDELLFFSVVRVPKAVYMVQPSYVESPQAGMMRVKSVWAVGGWSSGVPTKFEPVEFFVDAMAFSKVYEKRRALNHRGDVAQTMTLVRSTNVRMWLNGTPVGSNRRVETSLVEATAVAVEAMVAQSRLNSALVFDTAMKSYNLCMQRGSWFCSMLEDIMDMRALVGSVSGPITRGWSKVRGTLADAALGALSGLSVQVGVVGHHIPGLSVGPPERLLSGKTGEEGCCCPSACAVCDEQADTWIEDQPIESDSDTQVSTGSSVDDADTSDSWTEPDIDVITEETVVKGWRDEAHVDALERRSMEEAIFIRQYLKNALLTEVRVDAARLARAGCMTDASVLVECTTRTQHTLVRFQRGELVKRLGASNPEFMAMYDHSKDKVYRVLCRGGRVKSEAPDGWYYTNNHLKVWNTDEICAAISFALDYGVVSDHRANTSVVLGVPGAGKTYTMMKQLARDYEQTKVSFLVLAVTGKAAEGAARMGLAFGIPPSVLKARVSTLDKYLMHGKFPAVVVCVDEFPMAHAGDVDAALSIAGAKVIRCYGDGRQIPYDPFTREVKLAYSTMGQGISPDRITFLHISHRLRLDSCAAWLEMYPTIQSCTCHNEDVKETPSMSVVRISSAEDVKRDDSVRYHVYTRGEFDDLADSLRFTGDRREMKLKQNSGLASVHEDQGATHKRVCTVRLRADYDKNSSQFNPSFYNRLNYVLTDMTRDTHEYVYKTTSAENDEICKRVWASKNPRRLDMVRKGEGMGLTTLSDMLNGVYHPDILNGRSLTTEI